MFPDTVLWVPVVYEVTRQEKKGFFAVRDHKQGIQLRKTVRFIIRNEEGARQTNFCYLLCSSIAINGIGQLSYNEEETYYFTWDLSDFATYARVGMRNGMVKIRKIEQEEKWDCNMTSWDYLSAKSQEIAK